MSVMEKTNLWDEIDESLGKIGTEGPVFEATWKRYTASAWQLRKAITVPGDVIIGHIGTSKGLIGAEYWLDALAKTQPIETAKETVQSVTGEPRATPRRRKASPKAIALLERFKDVPSVDPHAFRADVDRVLDPGL
jgi:hypothetical protein